jgi:hypothetical protein
MAREIPSPILSSRHSDGYRRGSMMQEDLCIVFSMTGSKQQLPLTKRKQRLGAILVELTVLISTTNVLKQRLSVVLLAAGYIQAV